MITSCASGATSASRGPSRSPRDPQPSGRTRRARSRPRRGQRRQPASNAAKPPLLLVRRVQYGPQGQTAVPVCATELAQHGASLGLSATKLAQHASRVDNMRSGHRCASKSFRVRSRRAFSKDHTVTAPISNEPTTTVTPLCGTALGLVPVQNSPRSRPWQDPVQNSPRTPQNTDFGPFRASRENFVPLPPPTRRAGRNKSRTNTPPHPSNAPLSKFRMQFDCLNFQ